jgi:hypothetical protein
MGVPSSAYTSEANDAEGFCKSSMEGILPNKPKLVATKSKTTTAKKPNVAFHKMLTARVMNRNDLLLLADFGIIWHKIRFAAVKPLVF